MAQSRRHLRSARSEYFSDRGTIELIHGSKAANWVRGGVPKLASVSKVLKVTGITLGVAGVALE